MSLTWERHTPTAVGMFWKLQLLFNQMWHFIKTAAGKQRARPTALGQKRHWAAGGIYIVKLQHWIQVLAITQWSDSIRGQAWGSRESEILGTVKMWNFCQEQIVALLTCNIYKIAVASSWNLHWVLFTVPVHKENSDWFNQLQSSWKWLAWQLFMTDLPGIPSETD